MIPVVFPVPVDNETGDAGHDDFQKNRQNDQKQESDAFLARFEQITEGRHCQRYRHIDSQPGPDACVR